MRISAAEPATTGVLISTLGSGGVVIMPCDTIYGLVGVAPDTEERLRRIKGRGEREFLRLIASPDWLPRFTDLPLPESLKIYWPGPLTLIFPAKPSTDAAGGRTGAAGGDARGGRDASVQRDAAVEREVPGDSGTVALRVPRDPLLLSLMAELKCPLCSTSVNRTGEPPLWRIQEILEQFEDSVDLVVDAGDRPAGVPSTILDVSTSPFRLLRSGAVEIPGRLLG
jgi:L-threonylcarbamoyladenylate synthase